MILIDSPVWVGFLTGVEEDVRAVRDVIGERSRAVLSGVVLQEVLCGIADDEQRARVAERLSALPFLEATYEHFCQAASIQARRAAGRPVLSSSAALLLAHAALDEVSLLSRDSALVEAARELGAALYRPS